ncbi:MAG: hypothetical protein F6J93_39680 [Oscillatoria sp. SIO1A7]|nr:hypothetical protein [Oscillatoria sp. SIO1A7]
MAIAIAYGCLISPTPHTLHPTPYTLPPLVDKVISGNKSTLWIGGRCPLSGGGWGWVLRPGKTTPPAGGELSFPEVSIS